jgi:hypothetical protein
VKDPHEDDGKTVDMYHFKSRLDMILFAAFIIILLLIVMIYFQVTGTRPA